MFTAIQALLTSTLSLNLTVVKNEDGTITVTIIPKGSSKKESEGALNTPLTLTGTPEELDEEFASIIANFSAKRLSLAEQFAATEAILEAAEKESQSKATSAVKKSASSKPTKPAVTPSDEDEENDGGSSCSVVPVASSAPSTSVSPTSNNLWE